MALPNGIKKLLDSSTATWAVIVVGAQQALAHWGVVIDTQTVIAIIAVFAGKEAAGKIGAGLAAKADAPKA